MYRILLLFFSRLQNNLRNYCTEVCRNLLMDRRNFLSSSVRVNERFDRTHNFLYFTKHINIFNEKLDNTQSLSSTKHLTEQSLIFYDTHLLRIQACGRNVIAHNNNPIHN